MIAKLGSERFVTGILIEAFDVYNIQTLLSKYCIKRQTFLFIPKPMDQIMVDILSPGTRSLALNSFRSQSSELWNSLYACHPKVSGSI